jgi:hypothetical protein
MKHSLVACCHLMEKLGYEILLLDLEADYFVIVECIVNYIFWEMKEHNAPNCRNESS